MASTIRHNSTHSTPPADVASAVLTPVQAQVVRSLATGRSISAAAREAELHRSTVHNWLKDNPAFAAAVREARENYQNELSDELLDLSGAALQTLRALLANPETPPAVRLRTALAVLERPTSAEAVWTLPAPVVETVQNKPNPVPQPESADLPATAAPAPLISRSAPCPCGSGLKYKRCCGHDAPPVLRC